MLVMYVDAECEFEATMTCIDEAIDESGDKIAKCTGWLVVMPSLE